MRTVDSCSYRRVNADNPATAVCGLVGRLVEAPDEMCRVPRAACEACASSFPPNETDPNPVVASLAHSCAEALLATLDPDSVRYQRVTEQRDFAEANLPRVLPSESDVEPILAPSKQLSLEDLLRLLPLPVARSTSNWAADWAVGVTTAPRRQPTLEQSIQGLLGCGWADPYLFVDGAVELPPIAQSMVSTTRSRPIGAWHNFYLGLTELVERNPRSDAYVMVQDDVLWPSAPQLVDYLSEFLWPVQQDGIVSLYTSADDTSETVGWQPLAGRWKYGALAFIFPRSVARRMTGDPRLRRHGWKSGPGVAGVDAAIGHWAERRGIAIWHPTPSLVQHSGHVSAIWRTARVVGLRRASTWIGDSV